MLAMTEETGAETQLREPSMTAGEAEVVLFALERSRAVFAWKCGGLDAAGLNKQHPPSELTLAKLLKHIALIEDNYTAVYLSGQPMNEPWRSVDFDHEAGWDGWEWRTAADDSPEELYALWNSAVKRSRDAMAKVLADGGLDQPSKFTSSSGESPNIRRVLADLNEEYARHVGHADLLREAVDGLVGEAQPR